MSPATAETQVLIAGSGPVGLALAVELGTRGIECVLVEPRHRSRRAPRAKLTNVRSMEHMRRWNIAEELRRATPLPAEFSTDIAFVTKLLGGHEITRFSNAFNTSLEPDPRYSEPAQQVPQYVVERVLHARAEECRSIRFHPTGSRVTNFSQDDGGVSVEVTAESGETTLIHCEYLAGCDGGGSRVREVLGIPMLGDRGIGRNLSVVFRSEELLRRLPFAPALHFWTVNDSTPSFMGPMDRSGRWWLQATRLAPGVEADEIDPVELLAGALGERLDDIEVELTDLWEVHQLTAEHIRAGRVFLAGDAAHLHSPMGAHGMNQGLGDAVDLGWKLAAVLDGWGGSGLLDSYEPERAPFHVRALQEAATNYSRLSNDLVRPGLDDEGPEGDQARADAAKIIQQDKRREFNSLGLTLGHAYEGSPVIEYDGSPTPPEEVETYTPRCRPGMLAPHAWLGPGDSLYDRFGAGFALLCFEATADREALEQAAGARKLPLEIVTIDDPDVAALYDCSCVIVRPDQIVAWRSSEEPLNADALLDRIAGQRLRATA